ncbi:cytochrome b/b6 domain-containing protein [Mucilaginibacter xinganensis]|uniref:Cytochrome b561 n=1 Tax=Mucilaginibacter xinganensis TaxID=1234841 RepID=A0A223NZZ4_9SPHI|nr:cytochrome b/b6 domain-containing protein [Mucilaginibacter xinganensis]ASU35274.1 cytochrome b561 [Mucilaginibacter xinganensis]
MGNGQHKRWVKSAHFIITLSFLALTVSGYVILMSHPRLYWGKAGNDLTPALFELPISRNYHHGGWEKRIQFKHLANSQISAVRTYNIFNQNGWGRSTHFLAAWFLVITGLIYLFTGIFSGYFRSNLAPQTRELSFRLFWQDFLSHFRKQAYTGGQYGLLQKITYLAVIFFLFPVVILTGFTMSPAITASYPFLLKIFFGHQSARTIHFFSASALLLFLLVHVVMVVRSGFKRNVLAITFSS